MKMKNKIEKNKSTICELNSISLKISKWERNYEIHDKKMLAVIRGLENWRYLLEGAKYKFEVWTDHKNLESFIKA